MWMRGENLRFWVPVLLLAVFTAVVFHKLVRAHVDPRVSSPDYDFTRPLPARRGSVYSSKGRDYPFAKSVPYWKYALDPVALTNAHVRPKGMKRMRAKTAIVRTIADALGLEYADVLRMSENTRNRYQFLARSSDANAHRILADSSLVAGVAISETQERQYLHGRRLAHVLGSVNAEGVGSAGIEQRYNRELTGTPGVIQGLRDARGRELYDKRIVNVAPVPGADVYLTIDQNVQFEAEDALAWGVREYGAGSGWCVVMNAKTGAILAMASLPDFDPTAFGRTSDDARLNRVVAFNYEPGSVMKTITVAAAIDAGFVRPDSVYRTDRDDPRYYRLPGDGSHVWEPTMTVKDALVHSSNIVIGKLAYDFGPTRLHKYMQAFGFGAQTGIELPGEQYGILPNPNKRMWDKASQSRAGIGQFVAVTAIQLASAYQALANDGVRMKPYLVDRVVNADGMEVSRTVPTPAGRPVSARTARTLREMMLDVASPRGTARRAAIRGYSIAGKTGTAQKKLPGARGYAAGLYRASFVGIVPASAPELVVLVTLDFDEKTKFHQGGNSAGPVFRRIAATALRYLMVPPDKPEELEDLDEENDPLVDMMEERRNRIEQDWTE